MNDTPLIAPYAVLEARGQGARAGECLNAGIVLFTPEGPRVAVTQDERRLRALHPDFAAVPLHQWAGSLQTTLQQHAMTLGEPTQQLAMLRLFGRPFHVSEELGSTALDVDHDVTLRQLMGWLVESPARTLKVATPARKKSTKLSAELRVWLSSAKVFSRKVDDLSKGKVVANYPIDPAADLYADFAVLNGKLNAIETLDLRGVERLTSGQRGDAALKGVTLDEARERIDGKRVVVYTADNLDATRPALALVSRYADEAWDMSSPLGRQKLADFISGALHREQLPGLQLSH